MPLLILLIPPSTYSQNYSKLLSNSGWCCEQYFGTGAIYSEFYVSGDTLIEEQSYTVINDRYYLYEDTLAKQVWYLNKGSNELLYDFSLGQNDTFRIKLYDTVEGSFLVKQVDNIETLGGGRRRLVLNLIDSAIFEKGSVVKELVWIEGIGSTYGPLYPYTIPYENEFGGAGTCVEGVYSKLKGQIYQGYCTEIGGYHPDLCKFISSFTGDVQSNSVLAYFSAAGVLHINAERNILSIAIVDLSGRQIYYSENPYGNKEIQITNRWPTGIYLCKIVSYNNETHTLKLVKSYNNP